MSSNLLNNTDHIELFNQRLQSLIEGRTIPQFIAVEGPIGVGKTTLAKRLASCFNYEILLERAEENPFLEQFYKNRHHNALATQLFFLFQRAQQIQDIRQQDMFSPVRIADFLMEKDKLFAKVNLNEEEFKLYQQVYAQMTIDSPTPDLVIYLQAPVDTLMQRVNSRGISIEQYIDREYIETLNQAYSEFFLYYDGAPTLIINCAEMNFNSSDDDFLSLIDYMLNIKNGRQYFNPTIFS